MDDAPEPVNFCRYCLGAVAYPRTAYCCDEHARATRRQEARAAGRFRRWCDRQRRMRRQLALSHERWRDVAMGRDANAQLGLIFGGKAPEL